MKQTHQSYSRRKAIQAGLSAVCGLSFANTFDALPQNCSAHTNTSRTQWTWKQLSIHSNQSNDRQPLPRDPWNAMLSHKQNLYLFGGAYAKHGTPKGVADLKTLGTLNDLWKYDITKSRWLRLEKDNGTSGFSKSNQRPTGRVLPGWVNVDGRYYLFGGLSVLKAGWHVRLLNDLWQYHPQQQKWQLLEPDDQDALKPANQVGQRPTTLAAMGACVIDKTIYFFGGWGGNSRQVVLSEQLWAYHTAERKWTHLAGNNRQNRAAPGKRYCPAVISWQNELYLWGGRDTQDLAPQFYNDLWKFNPRRNRWELLLQNGPNGPQARYGMGHARIGHHWYIFGGFGNNTGNAPQLNDLWKFDLQKQTWTQLQRDNSSKDISPEANRPSVRRVPAMTASGESAYLYGGLDLASGPKHQGPLVAYNDLWQGTPSS